MPRLRRIKNYEIDFTDCREESSDEAVADEIGHGNYQGYESSNGQKGWWSNEAMVSAMPDNKLHQAVERYRSILRLCEQELVRRALVPDRPRRKGPLDNAVRRGSSVSAQFSAKTTKRPRGQQALTTEQMLKALEALCQMMQKKP